MLRSYLNQTKSWKKKTGENSYNESIYASALDIKCRIAYKRTLIRLANGEEITTNAKIHTTTAIVEGDAITVDGKDWIIRFVYPKVVLSGATIGYKGVM